MPLQTLQRPGPQDGRQHLARVTPAERPYGVGGGTLKGRARNAGASAGCGDQTEVMRDEHRTDKETAKRGARWTHGESEERNECVANCNRPVEVEEGEVHRADQPARPL